MDKNLGVIWAMLVGTATAMVYMFTTFVSVAQNDVYHEAQRQETAEFRVDIYYLQFYELLDKYTEAIENDREDFADELERQLERLTAKICEEDPEWERCHAEF